MQTLIMEVLLPPPIEVALLSRKLLFHTDHFTESPWFCLHLFSQALPQLLGNARRFARLAIESSSNLEFSSFTLSTPQFAISGSPAPNCHRETTQACTGVQLHESIAARSVHPSFE